MLAAVPLHSPLSELVANDDKFPVSKERVFGAGVVSLSPHWAEEGGDELVDVAKTLADFSVGLAGSIGESMEPIPLS